MGRVDTQGWTGRTQARVAFFIRGSVNRIKTIGCHYLKTQSSAALADFGDGAVLGAV